MDKKNNYWKQRIAEEMDAKIDLDKKVSDEYSKLHDYYLNNIEKEINSFYQRYGEKNGNISIKEVKKMASNMDVVAFADKAKRYVEEKNFSPQANEELSLYNLKMKVNRLELLQYNLDLEMVALTNGEHKLTEKFLNQEYISELNLQAGILGQTAKMQNMDALAKQIIDAPFEGATWSQNIWKRQSDLRQIVAREVMDGVLKGKNPTLIVPKLKKEFDVDRNAARRLAITEMARVQTGVQKNIYEKNKYGWYDIIPEPKACDICKEIARKGPFETSKMVHGLNAPPFHPYCRCSTAPNVEKERRELDAELDQWIKDNKEVDDKGGNEQSDAKNINMLPKESSNIKSKIREVLEKSKIEYNELKKSSKVKITDEIINYLGGGDRTKGSCSSLAFAYAGNKGGYDVLDFRGGKSREFFSLTSNIVDIAKLPNVKSEIVRHTNDFAGAKQILEKVEAGKEYYFTTGRHAAIVRKSEIGYEYLELQTLDRNGYKPLNNDTLRHRFGCKKSHSSMGLKLEYPNVLIDVDSLKDNEEFKKLLGYINTNKDNQRKGVGGNAK